MTPSEGGERSDDASPSGAHIADSPRLALGSVLLVTLASTDWLTGLDWATATTVGFLLYFIWPILSIALLCLTALFAIRDMQLGHHWQATAALVVSVAVVGFTFVRFHGWE